MAIPPEIKFNIFTVEGCKNMYGCSIDLTRHRELFTHLASMELEHINMPNDTQEYTEKVHNIQREIFTKSDYSVKSNKQLFSQAALYFLFRGRIEIKNEETQTVLPVYNENWASYADLWEYDKPSKIKIFPETFFVGVNLLQNKTKTDYNVAVKIFNSGVLREVHDAKSILLVAHKQGTNYRINGEDKFYDSLTVLSDSNGEFELETKFPCYLVLITPKE